MIYRSFLGILIFLILVGCTTTKSPINNQLKPVDKTTNDLFDIFDQFPYNFNQTKISALISKASVEELNMTEMKSGNTLLHLAFYKIGYTGFQEIIDQLLNKGASVDIINKEGHSFLMLIITKSKYSNFHPLIRKTLSKSKNIDQENKEGKTSWQILKEYKNYWGVEDLMDYIKSGLHLSVTALNCNSLDQNNVIFEISFNHNIDRSTEFSKFIQVVNSENVSQSIYINQLSDNLLEIRMQNFNISGRYFIHILKELKSTNGWNLFDDYKTPLTIYSVFKDVDVYARSTPESKEQSIETLSNYLTSPYLDTLFKIRAIFVWMTDRISYDFEGYINNSCGDLSPEMVLKTRKSVCAGYSNLFEKLCKFAGIKCETIYGFGKGIGYTIGQKIGQQTNHAWNVVSVGGRWHFAETTWGAGYIENRQFKKDFSDFYFLTPPEYFITSHFPQQTKWQLLNSPIKIEEFESLIVQDKIGKFGIQLISPQNVIIHHDGKSEILLDVPDDIDLMIKCTGNFQIIKKSNLWTISLKDLLKGESPVNIFARKISTKSMSYYGVLEYKSVVK